MNTEYQSFRAKAFSAMRTLAKESPSFEDAQMLVGSSEADASLVKQDVFKSIDTDWIDEIEKTLPILDTIVRSPSVAIEDVDEVLPVELSKHINDKSVKHLAQHTNLILDFKDDEVTPQKILNVYHDETYLTYENKFVNTLLTRLLTFVEKRYKVLADGRGTERNYKFKYGTSFEHHLPDDGGKNTAKIELSIELTGPISGEISESNIDINEKYASALERIERIHMTLMAFQTSMFVQKLGHNYIRPPVIRTNAILKNKDLKVCLNLWEYIESFDRVGYSAHMGEEAEAPSSDYIGDLHSSIALQYVNFYNGVTESGDNRLLSKKHLFDVDPEFSANPDEDLLEDYQVYDSEYKKMVPVSRLINNRKKLSDDEHLISEAITVALKADEIITQRRLEEEARRKAEEEARLAAEEAERQRLEEEARKAAEEAERLRLEEEAKRRAEEEARRKAEEEAMRRAEEEMARLAEAERQRLAEAEMLRIAEEMIARARAEEVYSPEDGNLEGRFPICPYTKKQYHEMPRKKKKQVKLNMLRVIEYKNAQRIISERRGTPEQIRELEERCDAIKKTFAASERWTKVLGYHTKVTETENG